MFVAVGVSQLTSWKISIERIWPVISVMGAALVIDLCIGIARNGSACSACLFVGAVLHFAMAYLGGATEWLWSLQPGRFSQPLYAILIVFVSVGVTGMVSGLKDRPWTNVRYEQLVLLLIAVGGLRMVWRGAEQLLNFKEVRPLRSALPIAVHEMVGAIKVVTDSSGRILFEDRGRLNFGKSMHDPFSDTNPSALLPLLAPGQYIGGPYLYTNLKSNFTQFGDGKLLEHSVKSLQFETFERYATLYNIRWMVCWSRAMVGLAESHREYFELKAHFGYLKLYALNRETNWALLGTAQVRAQPDRLEISNATPDSSGSLILSYHWISTLKSTAAIRPIMLEDDPVPFIAVDNAPTEFVIENRLW
jgi:hypothetical protein